MMNKSLFFIFISIAITVMPTFALEENSFDGMNPPPPPKDGVEHHRGGHFEKDKTFKQRQEEFETRLQLTDEQKAKAKEIREAGIKEMKPVMNAMQAKQEELRLIKDTDSSKEEIENIHKDLKKLHKKAHEIRMKNMKEFEEILTDTQTKELQEMKKEGRKEFELRYKECEKTGSNCKKPPFDSVEQNKNDD